MNSQVEKRRQDRPRPKRTALGLLNMFLWFLAIVVTIFLSFNLLKYQIGGFKYVNIIVIAGMGLVLLSILLLIIFKRIPKVTTFFLIIYLSLSIFGVMKLQEVITLFDRFGQSVSYDEYKMSVVVHADSDIKSIEQLSSEKILAPTGLDNENIQALLQNITETKKVTLKTQDVSTYYTAFTALLNKEAKAIVLNDAYESLIASSDGEYASKIKKIYEFTVRVKKVVPEQPATSTTQTSVSDVMHIYISGIDTYGVVSKSSRSDVNIIMSVNMKTHDVLLTSTPRDAYVKIAEGGRNQYDKLTHAGIYGINASIKTLENLYGIDINHYIRLNFTSFLKLIDVVGGVTVYNDYAFTSHHEPQYFAKGELHLDSKKALVYVRERYNLPNGDAGRAAHQQKVITALLNKLITPQLLANSSNIIQQLSTSVETDMSLQTIMGLVNKQMASNQSFKTQSQALVTSGKTLPSYAMGGTNVYMGVVDQKSLTTVKEKLKQIETATTPTN